MRKQTRTGGIGRTEGGSRGIQGAGVAPANQKLVSGTFVNLLNSFYACQLVNLRAGEAIVGDLNPSHWTGLLSWANLNEAAHGEKMSYP